MLAAAIPIMLSYMISWDFMGPFFGLYRTFLTDICLFFSQLLVAIMMVGRQGLISTYGIRLGSFLACIKKKTPEEWSLIVEPIN
jgi:hypothetical protein